MARMKGEKKKIFEKKKKRERMIEKPVSREM